MRDGSVVQSGAPKDVYDQPADLWAARFLGDLVELPADGDDALVSTPLGVLPVAATASGAGAGGTLVATLRPEQLHLDPAGVDGRVADITYYGHDAMITVNVVRPGGGVVPVRWRTVGGRVPAQGEAVRLGVTGGVRVYRA
jgi:iron(III) transport system ATP-binding protein